MNDTQPQKIINLLQAKQIEYYLAEGLLHFSYFALQVKIALHRVHSGIQQMKELQL